MNLYNSAKVLHACIKSCNTYEQLTVCEKVIANYRHDYYCQQVQKDYEALVVVIDVKRAELARLDRTVLKPIAVRYQVEWQPGDPTDSEGVE